MHRKYAAAGLVAISVSLDEVKDAKLRPKIDQFLRREQAAFANFILDASDDEWQEKLKISGPHNDIHYTVELPSRLDIIVRLSAGDLNVSGMVGSKDIELHAGDLNLHVGEPADYANVDLSVLVGDLNAGPWGAKSGIGRAFSSGEGRQVQTARARRRRRPERHCRRVRANRRPADSHLLC